ncbi:uncharacterized protein l(1)G0289 [Fopius arisanus]|uniref:Uncharacterized protein l(1)G0289 n=1 Tax=Fopius arisanus TaxID=64838 RepID=A0A9R1TIC4_9HYME|nr:PREDICTED: uncharacterized protein LOC105270729 [Fopius arisanus]
MACEQWCFLVRGCIVGFTLCLLVESSIVVPDDNDKYDIIGENEGIIKHVSQDGVYSVSREKRSVEPPPMANATTSPIAQDSIHNPPLIKVKTGSTANVTYSTNNASNSTTPPTISTAIAPTVKQEDGKSGQNITATSTPPSPAKVPFVWANETRWANATKDKGPTREDNKTTKVNLTQTSDSSDSDIDSITIDKFNGVTNTTLTQNNITKTEEDNHLYYNSTFIVDESIGKSLWIDLDNHPNRQVNTLLSDSHRRAATVKLTFDFPFYGHKVRNITIATGGFLYTGEFVHSWLAATQYIAPLMANFDTRLSKDSHVTYADNGTAFTVEWSKVILQDKQEAGPFTFQVTLHKNGNIVFVYSVMPLLVEEIEDKAHPVKVGLSDAYIMDKTLYCKFGEWKIHKKLINNLSRYFKEKYFCEITHSFVVHLTCKDDLSIFFSAHEHMNMNHMGVSGIIGILLVVSLIAGLAGWAAYAYRNPHSASGQMLIRYRPSQWNWRRGEARYTAATIHM